MASTILDAAKTTLAEATNVNVTPAFQETPLFDYEPVTSTTTMSTGLPRFGHSRNFSQLFLPTDNSDYENFLSSQAARDDYLQGLLFAGAFVLAIFVLWTIILLVLKFLCSKRVGFFSGRPFTLMEDEPTKDQMTQFHRQSGRTRLVFLLAACMVVVFSILFVSKGFRQVEATRNTADISLDNVRQLIEDARGLTEDLQDVGVSAIELRDTLVVELEKDRLCPNDPNYLAQDEIGQAINDNAGAAIDMLEMLGQFATQDIKQMEEGLLKADMKIDDFDTYVEATAEKEWVGIVYVLPLVVLTSLMMVGTIAAHSHRVNAGSRFLLSWMILPLFILWIVMSYVLCAGLAISASANADFCLGGPDKTPDSTILMSLQNVGLREDAIEFEIARYYLRQCTSEASVDPFLFLRKHEAEISNAQEIVQDLADSIAKIDVETLSFQCGRDFEPLSSSLDTMMAILDTLVQSAVLGLELLSCDRIVPIYAKVVYEGTCNHSVTGFTWMFSSLLVIATMGMIMITLRSSFQNNFILASETDRTDEDTEFNNMNRLSSGDNRHSSQRQADLDAAAYDLQLQEHERWNKEAGVRNDTSDSGSVYTDGNGDLMVQEVDPSELPPGSLPLTSFYLDALNDAPSYDTRGRPKPTAPVESYY